MGCSNPVSDFSRTSQTAGLGAGVTEAVAVVTPMEVVKIRLQAQLHSLADPLEIPRYRNAAHCVYTMLREEGIGSLYRGVSLTALRQATNQGIWREKACDIRELTYSDIQGANFTAYQEIKKLAHRLQPDREILPSYQHMVIGFISGAMGPFSNAPIDTIKTRKRLFLELSRSITNPAYRFTKVSCQAW
jgi:solute carrier family 25 citrate transporter 1